MNATGDKMAQSEKKKKKPETDEIATAKKDIDIFAGYLNRLENPDPILRTEARGKGLKLYDEIDRDSHAGAVLQSRYLAVVGREWEIIPGKSGLEKDEPTATNQDEKIAAFVRESLLNCNFDQARMEQLQAILYGYYPIEVMWKIMDGKVVIDKLLGKEPRRFSFTEDRELRLLTRENMIEGEEVPERKFISFTYGSSDNPYGKGLGRKLWWPTWFKKNSIKFWLIFQDKFSMPTPVGKYPPGTDKDKQQELLDALDAIQTETGVVIPSDMVIEFLEAVRRGEITYGSFLDRMDAYISKTVLGQTLTTEVGSKGSYAASKTHDEVRLELVKADADLHCECLNKTLIPWLVDFNFPNIVSYPKIWIRCEEEEDLKELAGRDKILVNDIGLDDVPKRYFHETYNIPQAEEGEEVVRPSKAPSPFQKGFKEFQEEKPHPVDIITRKALDKADMDSMIDPIEKILNESKSLPEFKEKLIDASGDLSVDQQAELLQKALTIAELAGRFDARN